MTEQTITLAERYVLGSSIAKGGMAEVWTARDEVLARTVAVKILLPHLAADPLFVDRFRAEALAAARLTHPNIVAVYDTGTTGSEQQERHFIVMEHCTGGTLSDMLLRDGPMDPQRVASVGSTICDALSYAHSQGIVHRDIKPANVLLSEHGSLKVTDFGIAKAAFVNHDVTTTGAIIGSVAYISPEQAKGDEPDARSDLYSLGITLYELLCGRPPFKRETDVATALSHIRERPEPVRSLRAGIPRQLEQVILQALEKDPDRRFSSAEAMAEQLAAISGGPSAHAFEVPPSRRSPGTQDPAPDASETQQFLRTEGRRIAPVLLLVVAAIVAAIAIASWVSIEENGGNGGPSGGEGPGQTRQVQVREAEDFDPVSQGGDGSEHPESVAAAFDGDLATLWQTSIYFDPLDQLKDGVGLVFDLGDTVAVEEVTAAFDSAGYAVELRAGDSIGEAADDFEAIDATEDSDQEHVFTADGTGARYWLVWITGLPGGSGRGAIAEVSFVGG